MRYVTIITMAILFLCLSNGALATPSEDNSDMINETTIQTPHLAPLNPAFIEYMEKLEGNTDHQNLVSASSPGAEEPVKETYPLTGLIPSPIDNSNIDKIDHASENNIVLFTASGETLPPYYDLRDENRVTPVRNQEQSGSCWAHAVYASLESCMIPDDGFHDFSENHMKNIMSENYSDGFDGDPNIDGGNYNIAIAYLSRWTGPVNESDDPYDDTSIYSDTSIPEKKHVQEVIHLPYRDYETSHDDDYLKSAVMEYGAVYSYFMINWTGFADNYLTYYYNGSDYAGGHAVALVGWNDSYPKEKFNITPPGDGAFICKNSWGTNTGDEGYFYISYYETSFNDNTGQTAVFIGADDTDNYDNIYQYDPLGGTNNIGYENETTNVSWASNIFTAGSDEYLNAVSFYTPDEMTDYELYIYNDPDQGPTNPSGYEYFTSGTFENAGYHTVDLSEHVILRSGQKFSVVIKFTDPDYSELIAIEKPIEDYSSKATANPGEGYTSPDGNSWTDITTEHENTSICIKAFTDDPHVTSISIEPVNDTIYAGETSQFSHDAFDQGDYPIEAEVVWSSHNETVGTIDQTSGLFTAHNAGKTTISVSNSGVTESANVTVLERPPFSIAVHEPEEGCNYNTETIFLKVSANLEVDTWMYNINATGNHTFNPNTTLTIPDGYHNLTVFANDTMGKMESTTVNFSIDTKAPIITIEHPMNTTYKSKDICLNVSADEDVDTWMYNVDNTGNHTFTPNTTRSFLEGQHNITVFANDTAGNVGSATVNFTIDLPEKTVAPRKSSSSSSGGGGGGNSGEAFGNIALKEVKSIFINKDSEITYEFEDEDNEVGYVGFRSLKNSGKITTTIEVLKGRSALVADNPPGMAYQHMNIWVGKTGFATESNIADPVIGFRVSSSWINENNIDETTITLYRNHDGKWTALPTTILSEDTEYIYFEAKTPGFSPFAIAGSPQQEEITKQSPELTNATASNSTVETKSETTSESSSLPMLPNSILITILGCAYFALRKRS